MKAVPLRNLSELEEGDIIQHTKSGNAYVVVGIAYRGVSEPIVTAVRSVDVSNPREWNRMIEEPQPVPFDPITGRDGHAELKRRYAAGKDRRCPYLAHADDCDCNGMGGDR